MPARPCRPLAAAFSLCLLSAGSASAQSEPVPLPDIVVTATRTPQAVSRAGSAITVITAEEIAKESPKSIADALRRSPGLSVTESGGPGSATTVRIRGAEPRHTMVLIDGIRVNDPSQAERRVRLRKPRADGYRAHRGSARAAIGPVRLRCDRRRDQHHHPQGQRRSARPCQRRGRFLRQQGLARRGLGRERFRQLCVRPLGVRHRGILPLRLQCRPDQQTSP